MDSAGSTREGQPDHHVVERAIEGPGHTEVWVAAERPSQTTRLLGDVGVERIEHPAGHMAVLVIPTSGRLDLTNEPIGLAR